MATIRPASGLALSRSYVVAVADGITDVAGRPLAATAWRFTTRIDADPLPSKLSVVLEDGSHRLVRFGPDGAVLEERTFDVVDRRWAQADSRARMPEQVGSWLRLDDPTLEGWWVAESPRSYALGTVEDALLAPDTQVTLPRLTLAMAGHTPPGPLPGDADHAAADVTVRVDRRLVTDGRTSLRLADARTDDAWVVVDPTMAWTEAASQRVIERTTARRASFPRDRGRRAHRLSLRRVRQSHRTPHDHAALWHVGGVSGVARRRDIALRGRGEWRPGGLGAGRERPRSDLAHPPRRKPRASRWPRRNDVGRGTTSA